MQTSVYNGSFYAVEGNNEAIEHNGTELLILLDETSHEEHHL